MTDTTTINNRYQLLDKLGQGGMGIVWRVYDRLEQQDVALKQVLIPEKHLDFASKAGTDDSAKLRLSLAQEFSILATLRHPHILSVLDYGFDSDGHPFYTMTLIEGGQDVKTFATNITTEKRIKLIGQMLQALHYLHRRGILHRDLKPDNVFVTPDEQIKVMDFGLAKLDRRQSAKSDTVSGTISYMAPELFQDGKSSVASDLFAVGVMVYEFMTGQHPIEAKNLGALIFKIMTEAPDMTRVPPELAPWLERLLAKDPADRYATAYDAMIAFYETVGVDAPTEDHAIRESFLQASDFVGREAELKQLTDALDTLDNQNAFFLIGGESGVGKSRLLDEFRIQALVKGATVLRGQGVEGGGLPFQLWRNIVRRMLLIVTVTDQQAGVLKDIVPDISELLGREITDAPELTGKAYQDRIVLTIVDLFRKSTKPVVLLLEDVQWTSESLAVLQQLLKVSVQLPHLMVVANYRDDEAPDLPAKLAGMTHTKLNRLGETAVRSLCASMLGERGARDEVVQTIQRNSEGNTFFMVETVRALAEEAGSLAMVTTAELPQVVFTGSMQELMQRRLRRVDNQYQDIQTMAAVIGREIDTTLLDRRFDESSVKAWLANASNAAVLDVQDNIWRFAHDKLRESLLADIPDEALPRIHRTAAETIEAVYPEDEGYNEALLRHWQQVDDLDKTYRYALPVAQNMIQITGAYATAESLLLNLLDRLPPDDARRISALNWLSDSAQKQGNYDVGETYATQAQQLATTHNDVEELATSLHNIANNTRNQGDYERAKDLYQQSLAIRQNLGDQRGISSCLGSLGNIAFYQGDYARATDFFQQSLAIQQESADQLGISAALNNLGVIASIQGDYDKARDLHHQSLAIKRQLSDQNGIAISLFSLGNVAGNQGDQDRAKELFQQSLVIRQALGDQYGISNNLLNLGNIAYLQGDYEQATDLYHQSLAIKQQIRDQRGIAHNFMGLGWVAFKQGQTQTIQWFSQALKTAHNLGAVGETLWAVVGFVGYLTQVGQTDRAVQFVGLAQGHPARSRDISRALDEVMPQLEAALSPDDLTAALEAGKSLDLDTVVAELLAEFGSEANQ